MSPERREKLQGWGYDDMCHLKVDNNFAPNHVLIFVDSLVQPFAEKAIQSNQNSMTMFLAQLGLDGMLVVDKLHFRGHKVMYFY